MRKWTEIDHSTWKSDRKDKLEIVIAYYNLDEIRIAETNEESEKVVLVTESNYVAEKFMEENYGIKVFFGN